MATAAKTTTKTIKPTVSNEPPPTATLLGVIETLLASPLKDALGKSAEILSGPLLPPATGTQPRVAVAARSMSSRPATPEQDPHDAREPAFFSQRFILEPNLKKPLDFPLPAGAIGHVTEVHAVSGALLRPGDAYTVDGATIRFYAPPAAHVGVQMRGARARGYIERTTCQVDLEIQVWAKDVPTSDTLTATAVATTLKLFAEMDTLDFTPYEASDFVLRMLKPLVRLTAIERGAAPVAGTDWAHAVARIVLTGELELSLVLGAPAAEGVIRHIEYTLK